MSKILITGSSGFIASNLIRYMLKNFSEYKISSIDNINDIKAINSIYYNGRHSFYIGDISNAHLMDRVFEIEKPDVIIHGASVFNNNSEMINANILGTQTLIDAAIKHKVDRFVYISDYKVYGPINNEDSPYTEESLLFPNTIYAATKASSELLLKAANIQNGLKYNILRLSNNYGPWQQKNNLITNIVTNIIENKEVNIYNKGEEINDWSFVQNTCSAIKTVVEKGQLNEIYNVSSEAEFSNIEVFNEICNIMGKGYELLKFVPEPTYRGFRYSANASKLKNLGWKPEYKFKGMDSAISYSIQWIKNNYSFYR